MKATVKYDTDAIKEKARQLVSFQLVDTQQPIYALYKYIPGRDWVCVELELAENDLLPRDRIIDLLGRED